MHLFYKKTLSILPLDKNKNLSFPFQLLLKKKQDYLHSLGRTSVKLFSVFVSISEPNAFIQIELTKIELTLEANESQSTLD
jgi:hypothetical protein